MNNNSKNLSDNIYNLLQLKHEGDFWDFKKQWHENLAELVHDIICMANSLKDGEKYIIIGVDEENDFQIVDVKNNKKRYNTANLSDILRRCPFVGGIRPFVRVEELLIGDKVLDVLVVEDSPYTPFVLADDYSHGPANRKKTVRQGNVYTRIGDTNTPLNQTADNDKVEALWKKRFHLDKAPLEKMNYFLRDTNGWSSDENGENYYYKSAPEYTISLDYEQEEISLKNDFLCRMYIDNSANYSTASLKVFGLPIRHLDCAYMDGWRFMAIKPLGYSILSDQAKNRSSSIFMTYIDCDSLEFGFYQFVQAVFEPIDSYQSDWWHEHVIFFRDESERLDFIKHVKSNFVSLREKAKQYKSAKPIQDENRNRYGWTKLDELDWSQTKMLAEEFENWKNNLRVVLQKENTKQE